MSVAIDIHRLGVALRLAGDRQRLEPVARRLNDLAAGRLRDALGRVEIEAPAARDREIGDGEIVFIDRLVVQCGANTAWPDDAIVAHIARRVALALQARLADPGLLRFRDRADFVAAALVAIVDGSAWRCWWFEELDGLQPLSSSAALRTLVINEGDAGVAALARLTEAALGRVLATLLESDALRLLVWFGLRSGGAAPPLAPLWPAASALPAKPAVGAWVRALVDAERMRAGSGGAASVECLRGVAALYAMACDGALALDVEPRAGIARLLASAGLAAEWLVAADESDVQALVADLASTAASAAADPSGHASQTWLRSPYGGFFVLLGRVQRLGWLAPWQASFVATGRTGEEGDALCRALAAQVAAVALAGPNAELVLHDDAVRAACAIDDVSSLVAANAALACAALRAVLNSGIAPPRRKATSGHPRRALPRLLAVAAARVLAEAARIMPGLAGSSAAFLRAQALALPVAVHVGIDGAPTAARLGRAPLNVLLVLAGVKHTRIELPDAAPIQCEDDDNS